MFEKMMANVMVTLNSTNRNDDNKSNNNNGFICNVCNQHKFENETFEYGCKLCDFYVCYSCIKKYHKYGEAIAQIPHMNRVKIPKSTIVHGFKSKEEYESTIAERESDGFGFYLFEKKETDHKKHKTKQKQRLKDCFKKNNKHDKKEVKQKNDKFRCLKIRIVELTSIFKLVVSLSPVLDLGTDIWTILLFL